ncbi:MAG: SLC13 family permease, partial [Planctomycetota bacterium]|nr:SLC13 family permease [Planctomycetota bacterium]
LMTVVGVLSAFMNNIAAVAVMMPAVGSIARRARIAPSRLFMPLSFGAILGGTLTLVGTPPNLLGGQMLEEAGFEPFSLFDFAPVGAALLAVGVVYMLTIGRKLLPVGTRDGEANEARELAKLYGLEDRLFSLRVPEGSHWIGRSLAEARFGTAAGLDVLAVLRDGETLYAPQTEVRLVAGDRLLLNGSRDRLESIAELRGVEVRTTQARALPSVSPGVAGLNAELPEGSEWIGRSLRDLAFRERHGLSVVAIGREGTWTTEDLGGEPLRAGDAILALGPEARLEAFTTSRAVRVVDFGFSALQPLLDRLFLIEVPASSPLEGRTLREGRIAERVGLVVGGVLREDRTLLAPEPDEELKAGDRLLVAGEPWRMLALLELPEMQWERETGEPIPESEDVGLVEASIAPRSPLAGHTLQDLGFRKKYGVQVLSIWSDGKAHHENIADRRLKVGDALLLQGAWDRIEPLAKDPDFVMLTEDVPAPKRTDKAPWAIAGLLAMVAMVVTGYQPIHVAAFVAASFTILSGALRMSEAYRAIEWRAIFLVAAVLPVGEAMQSTGAAAMLSDAVTDLAGPHGPYVVLAALVVLSSLLSQGLDGAPAVVLLAPVCFGVASTLGVSPRPILMAVALSASAAFMTPFSHKANLLVMGAGGYRSFDYVRVGTPLTVVVLALIVFMVPLIFPF